MLNSLVFRPDPERRMTFLEGSILVFTRDYKEKSHNFTTRFDEH